MLVATAEAALRTGASERGVATARRLLDAPGGAEQLTAMLWRLFLDERDEAVTIAAAPLLEHRPESAGEARLLAALACYSRFEDERLVTLTAPLLAAGGQPALQSAARLLAVLTYVRAVDAHLAIGHGRAILDELRLLPRQTRSLFAELAAGRQRLAPLAEAEASLSPAGRWQLLVLQPLWGELASPALAAAVLAWHPESLAALVAGAAASLGTGGAADPLIARAEGLVDAQFAGELPEVLRYWWRQFHALAERLRAEGRLEAAGRLIRLAAGRDPDTRAVFATRAPLGVEAIAAAIERAAAGFDPDSVPLRQEMLPLGVALRQIERHRGRRIMLAGRGPAAHRRPGAAMTMMASTAAQLGLEVATHITDGLIDGVGRPALEALAAAVRETQSELVLLDQWGDLEDPMRRQEAAAAAAELRAAGCRVASWYPDLWLPRAPVVAAEMAACLDALLVIHAPAAAALPPALRRRVLVSHSPLDLEIFRGGPAPRDIAAGFIGTTAGTPRAVWQIALAAAGSDVSFVPTRPDNPAERSFEEYAALLRRMRAVVNFSQRVDGPRILTGRVVEGMLCGALLLEEENEDTRYYFAPWVHYLPFESLRDLEQLVRFAELRPDLAGRVAAAGSAWAREHLHPAQIWGKLLDIAFAD